MVQRLQPQSSRELPISSSRWAANGWRRLRRFHHGSFASQCSIVPKRPSKPGDDGIWPAVAVRDVLEEVGNHKIANAMAIGLYNQRGVHWRDVDGRQERDLAAKYREWSKQTAVEWPFTSPLLEQIARSYDYDAQWHDTDANLRKRLP